MKCKLWKFGLRRSRQADPMNKSHEVKANYIPAPTGSAPARASILAFILTVSLGVGLLIIPRAAASGMSILTVVLQTAIDLGTSAAGIATATSSNTAFMTGVVSPQTRIISNMSFLKAMQSGYNPWMNTVFDMRVNSATLPQTQNLEKSMYGSSPSAVHAQYTSVYGSPLTASQANTEMISRVDMDDSTASASLSLATSSDKFSTSLVGYAQKLENQAAGAAPGTSDMVEAEAAVEELQSKAVQHHILAAILRERAIQLAGLAGREKQVINSQQQAIQQFQQSTTGGK